VKEIVVEIFWILLALFFLGEVILRANEGGKVWAKLYRRIFGDHRKSK
jgi:hypothetical protein